MEMIISGGVIKKINMENLTKEQEKFFYDWLGQFIIEQGYETYYNPTDGGDYRILTMDGVFYRSTYEWNNWLDKKFEEFNKTHNF
jgi:hypothetical protein